MHKILKSKMWQLFIVVAFLSTQSVSAHIHLASSHDHEGNNHDHLQILHVHNAVSHHVDAFDSNQETHTGQTVGLYQDLVVKYGKCLHDIESKSALVFSFYCHAQAIVNQGYINNSFVCRSFHLCYESQARAPPIVLFPHV